jgi:hypothetical protein
MLGKFIVTQYLLYTQVKTMPRLIFTVTFMCSLSLLVLVLFEIVEIGSSELRIHLWYITLLSITAICILVVPNLIIFKMLYLNNRKDSQNTCSSRVWLSKLMAYVVVALSVNFLYFKIVAEKSQEILEVKKEFYLDVGLFNDLHVNVLIEFISKLLVTIQHIMARGLWR